MNFMTYGEWLKKNRDDFLVADVVCKNCNGSGQSTCCHCGSYIDCPKCDGYGKLRDDSGELVVDEIAARVAYDAAIERDKNLAALWGLRG